MTASYLALNPVRGALDVVSETMDGQEYRFLLTMDGQVYAMALSQVVGSWFEGIASLASGWQTRIAARRYIDDDTGTVLFRGYWWQEEAHNFPWIVEMDSVARARPSAPAPLVD